MAAIIAMIILLVSLYYGYPLITSLFIVSLWLLIILFLD